MRNLILLVSFAFFYSCSSGLKLQFKNGSDEDFKKITADIGKNKYNFYNLKRRETTKTIKLEGSYPYCPITVITEKDTLKLIPIDYDGEKYYKSGKLKMILMVIERDNNRAIDIIVQK
jgi:hypothetical protein